MSDPPLPLAAAVRAALPALGTTPWQPLAGGRTNRLWRAGGLVVKAYDPAAASPLFPNDPAAEVLALTMLAGTGLAPILRATGSGWIAYDHVPGRPWQGDPAPVARALHRVHGHQPAGFRALASGSAAILAQGQAIAARCSGAPPPPPDPGIAPVTRPCLIHADAVPGNMIVAPGALTLIDWQCPAAGDPAEDLAMFLSPAMQWLYRGAVLGPGAAARLCASYPDPGVIQRLRALAPVIRWRMTAHCLWKAQRGAPDYAEALRFELAAPDPF